MSPNSNVQDFVHDKHPHPASVNTDPVVLPQPNPETPVVIHAPTAIEAVSKAIQSNSDFTQMRYEDLQGPITQEVPVVDAKVSKK